MEPASRFSKLSVSAGTQGIPYITGESPSQEGHLHQLRRCRLLQLLPHGNPDEAFEAIAHLRPFSPRSHKPVWNYNLSRRMDKSKIMQEPASAICCFY